MASKGTAPLKTIFDMLEDCAPGHRCAKKKHHWWVYWKAATFPSLPLGEHGARENPDIQFGVIRQMIRQLKIGWECARRHIPGI